MSGRLVFATGVRGLKLTADPTISYLYQDRVRPNAPSVWIDENIVVVEYKFPPYFDQLAAPRSQRPEITLNSSIPWEIEFRNGVSHLDANLVELPVRSLDILGGASEIRLALSTPSRTTFIYFSGGLHHGVIRVPSTSEMRVQISGRSTYLNFMDRHFRAIGGETSLESPGYNHSMNRFDVCIAGGASQLTVERIGWRSGYFV